MKKLLTYEQAVNEVSEQINKSISERVLEAKAIEQARHAVGLDYKNSYCRNGKRYYKPYRNCYLAPKTDNVWAWLMGKEYAEVGDKSACGDVWWILTRKGLDWLGEQLDIKIYDEDR